MQSPWLSTAATVAQIKGIKKGMTLMLILVWKAFHSCYSCWNLTLQNLEWIYYKCKKYPLDHLVMQLHTGYTSIGLSLYIQDGDIQIKYKRLGYDSWLSEWKPFHSCYPCLNLVISEIIINELIVSNLENEWTWILWLYVWCCFRVAKGLLSLQLIYPMLWTQMT